MDDISFLVNETFKSVENRSRLLLDELPESCGLFYTLAENASTYVIRGIASKNIRLDFEKKQKNGWHQSLKMAEKETTGGDQHPFFFETQNWEQAQLIIELACQKRFLKSFAGLANLSDPQLTWAYYEDKERNHLVIDLSGRNKGKVSQDKFQLGYLGETALAFARFSQLLQQSHFKDEVRFSYNQGLLAKKIKEILIYSQVDKPWFLKQYKAILNPLALEAVIFYLEELALMAKFWRRVFSKLTKS